MAVGDLGDLTVKGAPEAVECASATFLDAETRMGRERHLQRARLLQGLRLRLRPLLAESGELFSFFYLTQVRFSLL